MHVDYQLLSHPSALSCKKTINLPKRLADTLDTYPQRLWKVRLRNRTAGIPLMSIRGGRLSRIRIVRFERERSSSGSGFSQLMPGFTRQPAFGQVDLNGLRLRRRPRHHAGRSTCAGEGSLTILYGLARGAAHTRRDTAPLEADLVSTGAADQSCVAVPNGDRPPLRNTITGGRPPGRINVPTPLRGGLTTIGQN
jgi:hypothetical protein